MSDIDFSSVVIEASAKGQATYPADHVAGMKVPKGGSNCEKCEYWKGEQICGNKYFIKWNGSDKFTSPADEYCCDWFEAKEKEVKAATETALAGDQKGTIWNGIKIVGFTGPEEEGLRALLSRVPPELLFNVKEIQSAPELNAKHGQFIPEGNIVKFNPKDFTLRQRFGKGPGWMLHQELTVVHEVGHSIYEQLSPEQKKEWLDISGWMKGTKPGQAEAYEEKRPGWPHIRSKWTHKAGIYTPRHYSEKNPNEQFSDCFAFVILGKGHQMEPECKKFIDNLIKGYVKKYPAPLIASPSSPYPDKTAIRKSKTV